MERIQKFLATERITIIGVVLILAFFSAVAHSDSRAPFVSSEIRFTELSEAGLDIVPASCSSAPYYPHFAGDCTCPTGAQPAKEGASGYELLTMLNRRIDKHSVHLCVDNTSANQYFVPGNTPAEVQAFKNAAGSLSGIKLYVTLMQFMKENASYYGQGDLMEVARPLTASEPSYGIMGILGSISPIPGTGLIPLYLCKNIAAPTVPDYFVSTSAACEGTQYVEILGYGWSASAAGRVPMYRCRGNVATLFDGQSSTTMYPDHWLQTSSSCTGGGYYATGLVNEGILFYAESLTGSITGGGRISPSAPPPPPPPPPEYGE